VPRPRLHLIRFHGVLAPNAKLRALVVSQGPAQPERVTAAADAAECNVESVQSRPHQINWARLLERALDIDVHHCPNSGAGEMKIIAAAPEAAGDLENPGPPDGERAAAAQESRARPGVALRCLSRVRCQRHLTTGFAATLQPGWRCAPCRHNAVDGRVNPEAEAGTGPLELSRTSEIGAT
jgi:hypothetical protein